MSRRRLIWDKRDPAPYESAWSIFSKILALNRLTPHQLYAELKRADWRSRTGINTSSSAWVDFDKFEDLIQIPAEKLKLGFLDQLGFSNAHRQMSISHCPVCRSCGYHNVFFELALVTRCPVHDVELERCTQCLTTVERNGLYTYRRQPRGTDGFKHVLHFVGDICKSSCGHIRVDFDRLNCDLHIDESTKRAFETRCTELLSWYRRICCSNHPARTIAASFHRPGQSGDIEYRMDLMRRLAGDFPWHHTVKVRPASFVAWRKRASTLDADEQCCITGPRDPQDLELFRSVFKAVRRYIFRRFILSGHLTCWKELKRLTYEESQWLCSERLCTVAIAYAAWYLAAEGLVNVEALRTRHRADRFRYEHAPFEMTTPEAHAHAWYAKFLFALDGVTRACRLGGFRIKRRMATAGALVPRHLTWFDEGASPLVFMTVPDPDHLLRHAGARCQSRPKRRSTMFLHNYLEIADLEAPCYWESGTIFLALSALKNREAINPHYVIRV